MSLESMATPEPGSTDLIFPSSPDLNQILQRQIAAGFPPELAFDLVLHELVVRAAAATDASAAALALVRGNEMVCRAATGLQAPDLGVPVNTDEGLSGACVRTRQAQLCHDAESDPRVDADAARRLGISSMLIVPLLEDEAIRGILEVFSSRPTAFAGQQQTTLQAFADDCIRLQRAMHEEPMRLAAPSQLTPLAPYQEHDEPRASDLPVGEPLPAPPPVHMYEGWTLLVGTIAIIVAIGVSFLIGSRIGWIRVPLRPAQVQTRRPAPVSPKARRVQPPISAPAQGRNTETRNPDELVVYDHGKVIFRMKPEPKNGDSVISASENTHLTGVPVWLAPEQAERMLKNRIEPAYPQAAIEARRAGDVVLEVVVGRDGSIVTERIVSGDPLLISAALDAVRRWRYEPYRRHQRATRFQTTITLRFSLPK
jgi:TonB family protein